MPTLETKIPNINRHIGQHFWYILRDQIYNFYASYRANVRHIGIHRCHIGFHKNHIGFIPISDILSIPTKMMAMSNRFFFILIHLTYIKFFQRKTIKNQMSFNLSLLGMTFSRIFILHSFNVPYSGLYCFLLYNSLPDTA